MYMCSYADVVLVDVLTLLITLATGETTTEGEPHNKTVGFYRSPDGVVIQSSKWSSFVNASRSTTGECINEIVTALEKETVPSAAVIPSPTLQTTFLTLQIIIASKGGMIRQLLVDDKGLVIIVAFGVMQHSFTDNGVRAVDLAFEARAALKRNCCDTFVGISTGEVYTGSVGNAARREYAMVGNKVNLAARLMSLSARLILPDSPSILCDYETFKEVNGIYKFKEYDAVSLKGMKETVKIYSPAVKMSSSISTFVDIDGRLVVRTQC